jgi:small subunit ribosomal protein S9
MPKEKKSSETTEKKEKKAAVAKEPKVAKATKEPKEPKKVAVKKEKTAEAKEPKKKVAKKKEEVTEATGVIASEVAAISDETKKESARAMNEMFGLVSYDFDDESDLPADVKYDESSNAYFVGTGRRKTSVARVRLYTKGEKTISVNQKKFEEYFSSDDLQRIVLSSLDRMKSEGKFKITVVVKGGGIRSQAEAVRHGIARALTIFNPEYRKRLRRAGYLTRDQRMKERKKFGLKRARRAPQWSKR